MNQKTVIVISENFTDKTPLGERLRIIHNLVEENLPHFQNLLMLSIDFLRYSKESKETLKIMKDSSKNQRTGITDYLELSPEYGAFVHIFICGLIYQKMIFPEASSFEKQANIFSEMFFRI